MARSYAGRDWRYIAPPVYQEPFTEENSEGSSLPSVRFLAALSAIVATAIEGLRPQGRSAPAFDVRHNPLVLRLGVVAVGKFPPTQGHVALGECCNDSCPT